MSELSKRIFVGNLPDNASESQIRSKFSSYGEISSIQLKNKVDAFNNVSYFAFVCINVDDRGLQKCLYDISNTDWGNNHYVNVQLAKESFLDKLKREREEANAIKEKTNDSTPKLSPKVDKPVVKETFEIKKKPISPSEPRKKQESSSSSSSSSSESDDSEPKPEKASEVKKEEDDLTDFVIKSNKGKRLNGSGLKIESFGNAPIHVVCDTKAKPKSKDPKRSEADEKRKKSMLEMKKGYRQQKSYIQTALSKTDAPRTVTEKRKLSSLDEDGTDGDGLEKSKRTALRLFDEEDDAEQNYNFGVNEELTGEKGKKLLALQSKFNHDKRFAMDSRFLEEEEEEEGAEGEENGVETEEIMTHDDEVRKQFKILGDVLGQSMDNATLKKDIRPAKAMLRFDPSAPHHTKYELEMIQKEKQTGKKKKIADEKDRDAQIEEANASKPEVSQEQFYKVNEDFKKSLQNKQEGFSLLNLFGRSQEGDSSEQKEETSVRMDFKTISSKNMSHLDSSDDEAIQNDVTEETPKPTQVASWNENFFFSNNDDRFQEGLDFFGKLKTGTTSEFKKLRQDLKDIVRTKVRQNLRKNKPFKKKLGGKKMLRIKKAMKR